MFRRTNWEGLRLGSLVCDCWKMHHSLARFISKMLKSQTFGTRVVLRILLGWDFQTILNNGFLTPSTLKKHITTKPRQAIAVQSEEGFTLKVRNRGNLILVFPLPKTSWVILTSLFLRCPFWKTRTLGYLISKILSSSRIQTLSI